MLGKVPIYQFETGLAVIIYMVAWAAVGEHLNLPFGKVVYPLGNLLSLLKNIKFSFRSRSMVTTRPDDELLYPSQTPSGDINR